MTTSEGTSTGPLAMAKSAIKKSAINKSAIADRKLAIEN
jgi:hypothetical protein